MNPKKLLILILEMGREDYEPFREEADQIMRQDVDKFRPRLLKILYGKGPKTNAGGIRTKPTTRKTKIMSETIATIGPNKWSSARTGGEEKPVFTYELWPGVPAVVNGVTYPLQHS